MQKRHISSTREQELSKAYRSTTLAKARAAEVPRSVTVIARIARFSAS